MAEALDVAAGYFMHACDTNVGCQAAVSIPDMLAGAAGRVQGQHQYTDVTYVCLVHHVASVTGCTTVVCALVPVAGAGPAGPSGLPVRAQGW